MPKHHDASASDNKKKRLDGPYSTLPPTGWNCAPHHEEFADEDVQPGDENFEVCYDNGRLIIVHDGDSYHGHISANHSNVSFSETWKGIVSAGLLVTSILPTPIAGEYSLRLRELTDVEKEVLHEYITL